MNRYTYNPKGWIGVDFDGTLATYTKWKGPSHLGEPILPMVQRVKDWLTEGKEVRIFTARAFPFCHNILPETFVGLPLGGPVDNRAAEAIISIQGIREWCQTYIGVMLPITCVKDHGMIELWDDRVVQVQNNLGYPVAGQQSRIHGNL